MSKNIVLFVQGGFGDVLAHTPMIRYFRNTFPKDQIVVIASHPEMLKNNPNIDHLYGSGVDKQDQIYEKYMEDRSKLRFFKNFFIYNSLLDSPGLEAKNLPEFICNLFQAEYDGNPSEYYMTEYEKRSAHVFLSQFSKPVILVQRGGSVYPDQQVLNHKDLKMEVISGLVEKYKEQFDFVQIGSDKEQPIPQCMDALGIPIRDAINLIPYTCSFIFIESVFAHAANAFKKRGVVTYQNMDPEFFGHPNAVNVYHKNDCPKWPCNRPLGSLLDYEPGYVDPKNPRPVLWRCLNQVCAEFTLSELEQAFLLAVNPEKENSDEEGTPEKNEEKQKGKPPHLSKLDEIRNS